MEHLDYTLEQTIAWWSTIDQDGKSLEGVRALCLVDRYYLLVKVCKRMDMLHPWIYERCREVEKDPDGHLDLWAREHYKSTIITFGGIIQRILQDAEITICIFSHVGSIAADFMKQIKAELETNTVLQDAFPDILYRSPSKEAKQWSVEGGITVKRKSNPKEATLESSGLVDGQPISKHYKLRVYDDVVTDKSVNTPEQITKTTNAYSLSQSLGMIGGDEWMIGTRYSYADTYDWIISRNALKVRKHAVTKNGEPDGELVLFTRDEWNKRLKKNTDSDIACQYMQDPLSGQQKMFRVEDLQEYEVRPETLAVYILVDPARSMKKDSDNTAIIVCGLDYASNKYLLDGFNHKMDLKQRWENLHRMWVRWKQQPGVAMVHVGYEEYGAQADLDYIEEQMKIPQFHRFDITRLAWPREGGGSKIDRVQRLVPDCKSHRIYLPYATNADKLTSNQRKMVAGGYMYRVSQSIKRKDENGVAYDLSEQLRSQFHFFPFGGKKDAIDALARIYDMTPRAPSPGEPKYAEPLYT